MASRNITKLSKLVGLNIAERRRRAGLTQEALGEHLGITGAAVSRIESGQATPRFSRLEDLAQILKCQVADLFRSQDQPLDVKLDTIEDMLRPLPTTTQKELLHLLVEAIRMVKNCG